jgi:outer membrane lipoprotein-sorting protein
MRFNPNPPSTTPAARRTSRCPGLAARGGRLVLFFAVASLAIMGAVRAAPAPDAPQRLYRDAVNADDRVSYYGTVTTIVYGRDHAMSTVARVEHKAPNLWRIWYMAPADAYGRLIVSNERQTYAYEPHGREVVSYDWYRAAPGVAQPVNVDQVLRNYAVDIGPTTPIAGRSAVALSLVSRYTGRLVQRVWLDKATHLILRRESYNAEGAVAIQSGFDTVRIGVGFPPKLFSLDVPPGDTLVRRTDDGIPLSDPAQLGRLAGFMVVVPKYLPEGFVLQTGSIATHNGVKTVQLVYGDGLRTFSLFENATGRLPAFRGATTRPVQIAHADGQSADVEGQTVVSWNSGGLNLTIVGSISERESELIGASIHRP